MRMKRTLILLIVLLLVFSISATAQTIVANFASTFPRDCPMDKGLVMFKELVEERSNGRIEIRIHTAGSMGDEQQTTLLVSQASVEYGAIGSFAYFYPKFNVAETPFLFSGPDDFWKYWNGPGQELFTMIEKERRIKTVGNVLRGAEYLTASRPIRSVEDVKGLKLRMYPVDLVIKAWESLGANVTQIAFNELYMALKTGTVEAQTNPPETILNYKFYEAQEYLMATEHLYPSAHMILSMDWWDTLSKEDQTLLTKAMDESVAYMNSLTKNGDEVFVKELQELGMTLIKPDMDSFKKAMEPAINKLAEEYYDPDFFAKAIEALE